MSKEQDRLLTQEQKDKIRFQAACSRGYGSHISDFQVDRVIDETASIVRKEILGEIELELNKLYKQFDKFGEPVDDDAKATQKVFMMSENRWQTCKERCQRSKG